MKKRNDSPFANAELKAVQLRQSIRKSKVDSKRIAHRERSKDKVNIIDDNAEYGYLMSYDNEVRIIPLEGYKTLKFAYINVKGINGKEK